MMNKMTNDVGTLIDIINDAFVMDLSIFKSKV